MTKSDAKYFTRLEVEKVQTVFFTCTVLPRHSKVPQDLTLKPMTSFNLIGQFWRPAIQFLLGKIIIIDLLQSPFEDRVPTVFAPTPNISCCTSLFTDWPYALNFLVPQLTLAKAIV